MVHKSSLVGHAWDHEVKDFKVVYRPLYHCTAKEDRFEAHCMAVSHFSRWEEKFRPVPPAELSDLWENGYVYSNSKLEGIFSNF